MFMTSIDVSCPRVGFKAQLYHGTVRRVPWLYKFIHCFFFVINILFQQLTEIQNRYFTLGVFLMVDHRLRRWSNIKSHWINDTGLQFPSARMIIAHVVLFILSLSLYQSPYCYNCEFYFMISWLFHGKIYSPCSGIDKYSHGTQLF